MDTSTALDRSRQLAELLRRERIAMADFLLALADFDRRRLWEALGHPSLFMYLHRELGLSRGTAYYRQVAAGLVRRFPEVVEPLRDGRLCITSVVELAKVITPENRGEVLPRFFHCSKQEAKEVAVEIRPAEAAPRREVVTAAVGPARVAKVQPVELGSTPTPTPTPTPTAVEPLTADLRRLHITVSRRFLQKLDAARDALSHSHPGADAEAILEAGLDLLLSRQAKRRAQVERPHAPRPPASSPAAPTNERHIPAHVRREVWARDGGRCQWPLASGGICGSTHRPELDHVVPLAAGGPSTAANLRILCRPHNALAARLAFGDDWMNRCRERAAEEPAAHSA